MQLWVVAMVPIILLFGLASGLVFGLSGDRDLSLVLGLVFGLVVGRLDRITPAEALR
jgi:hypothetical protein